MRNGIAINMDHWMRTRATLMSFSRPRSSSSVTLWNAWLVKFLMRSGGPLEGLLNIKFKSEAAAIWKSSAWRYRLKSGTVSNHTIYYHHIPTSPKRRTCGRERKKKGRKEHANSSVCHACSSSIRFTGTWTNWHEYLPQTLAPANHNNHESCTMIYIPGAL